MVRIVGLEPTRVASLPPQSSVSAIPPYPHIIGSLFTYQGKQEESIFFGALFYGVGAVTGIFGHCYLTVD